MNTPQTKTGSNKNTRVTLGEVAARCKVSKATVCRVLNNTLNNFPVSEKMIQRVTETAAEMGYRPNRLAQAIRTRRTRLIGLSCFYIDPKLSTPAQALVDNQQLGAHIGLILSHPGFAHYDLVIHPRREDSDQPLGAEDLKTELLDGMIYMSPSDNHLEFLNTASPDFPIVVMGRTPEAEKKAPCVDIDNVKTAATGTVHLIQNGFRRLLLLVPEELQHMCCMQDRIRGFQETVQHAGSPAVEGAVHALPSNPDRFHEKFTALMTQYKPDAVFGLTDRLALLAHQELLKMERRIPDDTAVLGFENTLQLPIAGPALSTISRPVEEQVRLAVDILLESLENQAAYKPGFIEVEAELTVQESTVRRDSISAASIV